MCVPRLSGPLTVRNQYLIAMVPGSALGIASFFGVFGDVCLSPHSDR
jgi:hypothetical protein